ncbi:MAG: DUF6309 family protein [Candidatus Woesearchaeota archaeon]
MKPVVIEKKTFEQALNVYLAFHGTKNQWEIQNLKEANKKFSNWVLARIPIEDVGEIVMPYHHYNACAGLNDTDNYVIIPPEGLTLTDAYARFLKHKEEHKQKAPICYAKIMHHKNTQETTPFFLSQEPLFTDAAYENLHKHKGKITHLDGLHRLIALMDSEQKPAYINAFIALSPQGSDCFK